ncbi:hypothetical protein [Microbacterium soli]|uniref:Uncharacterized protein n=1 Tax=Microbacterium soli TaxID=446075 RepID=A0ABP7MZN9_9MICO
MGLFSQKQQDPAAWAALPGEPLDEDKVEHLDEAPTVDLLGLGLGTTLSSTVITVTAPTADPAAAAEAAPEPESAAESEPAAESDSDSEE